MKHSFLIIVFLFILSFRNKKADTDRAAYYQPKIGDTFEWRLDSIPLSDVKNYHCDIIDIDAFSATKELVDEFHKKGIKVIAYVSVGTFENYRTDGQLLPKEVIGKRYNAWPDERFLDIRQIDLLRPMIKSRFDMIQEKGFDGIEADNIDSYSLPTGFKLTLDDTKKFCAFIIEEAHKRNLSIGQKNTEELVPDMHTQFDWALTESVFKQKSEAQYSAYIKANKPVFSTEYSHEIKVPEFQNTICPIAKKLQYYVILKHRDLTKWSVVCP